MATIPASPPSIDAPIGVRSPLTVSSYERTATMVIALLVVFGTLFGGLAIVFFADKFGGEQIEAIAFVPTEGGSPTANGGISDDPEPPGVEDAPDLSEPALQDTLAAVAATTSVLSDALISERAIQGTGEQAGKGSGLGDGRQPGRGGEGVVERVPRWQRWKIRFEPASAADFAEWLDQYGIRVGVLGRDNKVHVAWDFSKGSPQVQSAEPTEYNDWGQTIPADGPMPKLTADLARKANIMQRGPIALLFYPKAVEDRLWTLEQTKNTFKDANKVRETVFTVIREADGFAFAVIDQRYF